MEPAQRLKLNYTIPHSGLGLYGTATGIGNLTGLGCFFLLGTNVKFQSVVPVAASDICMCIFVFKPPPHTLHQLHFLTITYVCIVHIYRRNLSRATPPTYLPTMYPGGVNYLPTTPDMVVGRQIAKKVLSEFFNWERLGDKLQPRLQPVVMYKYTQVQPKL